MLEDELQEGLHAISVYQLCPVDRQQLEASTNCASIYVEQALVALERKQAML